MSVVPALAAINMGRMLNESAERQAKHDEWASWVGKPIRQKNRRSFNTGAKTAIVRGIMNNERLGLCFTIVGDDVLIPCASVHVSKPGIEQ